MWPKNSRLCGASIYRVDAFMHTHARHMYISHTQAVHIYTHSHICHHSYCDQLCSSPLLCTNSTHAPTTTWWGSSAEEREKREESRPSRQNVTRSSRQTVRNFNDQRMWLLPPVLMMVWPSGVRVMSRSRCSVNTAWSVPTSTEWHAPTTPMGGRGRGEGGKEWGRECSQMGNDSIHYTWMVLLEIVL